MDSSSVRSKRRRLMPLYVSPRRPDLPAIFESLNDDTLTTVLEFVGKKSYRSFGGVNKRCKEVYLATKGMTKETYLYGYGPLSRITDRVERYGGIDSEVYERAGKGVVLYNRRDVMEWAVQERKKDLLKEICGVASKEGRIDLLDEVWNDMNNEDDRGDVFEGPYLIAIRCGKLNVLKWLETKGFTINKEWCAFQAAYHDQLRILQWLKEEKGLELDSGLYNRATNGNHLHILKWLRQQEVPWNEYHTFRNAAEEGNLEVLQWLHDEGCPWYNEIDLRVYEEDLEPEVLEWCITNGYSSRIWLL